MPRSDYTLKTLRKGLEVLETLADDRDALTLTALAARLQESPPVVFRILRTLEERGYVEQDAGSKRWQPGFRAWEIGCRVVNRTGLVEARSEEHTSELQSPCNLVCRLLLEKKKNNSSR